MTPEQARALAGSYYTDFNRFAKRNDEVDAARANAANDKEDWASYADARATVKQNDRPGIATPSEGGQNPEVIRTRDLHDYDMDADISLGRKDYAAGLMDDYKGLQDAGGVLLDLPSEIRDKYPDIDPEVLEHMYSDLLAYTWHALSTARQGVVRRNSMGDVPDSRSYLGDDDEHDTTAGIPKDTAAQYRVKPKIRPTKKASQDSESFDKDEVHIPTWDEIRKSIANRDTAEYLHEKYKPYPRCFGERRRERESPHQPSIQSAIDALTSQQAEDERISTERDSVSDAGWDRGVRDAQAIIDQYKGKIPDEEIVKMLNALQRNSAPTDFRPFDEGLSPDEQYSRAMNYAGYVENLDGKYNDYFAGDRTGGPAEDPVVSAVKNNVYHQESLRNNRDERLDMARSVGVGRRRSRFEHESEEEKKGEKEEE